MEIAALKQDEIEAKGFVPIVTDAGTYFTRSIGDTTFVAIDDRSKHQDIWGYRDGKRMGKDEAERHVNRIFRKEDKGNSSVSTTKEEMFGEKAEAEVQRIREEQGMVPTSEATVKEYLTVPELIAKYTDMLALVTEAVAKEDRIPDREKGYAVKFIFYSVRGAMQNGSDREEK